MGRTACTEPHCLYKGALYVYSAIDSFHGSSRWSFATPCDAQVLTLERVNDTD